MKNKRVRLIPYLFFATALLSSVPAAYYSLTYTNAGSPTCSETKQSAYFCDPSRYDSQMILWICIALVLFISSMLLFLKYRNRQP